MCVCCGCAGSIFFDTAQKTRFYAGKIECRLIIFFFCFFSRLPWFLGEIGPSEQRHQAVETNRTELTVLHTQLSEVRQLLVTLQEDRQLRLNTRQQLHQEERLYLGYLERQLESSSVLKQRRPASFSSPWRRQLSSGVEDLVASLQLEAAGASEERRRTSQVVLESSQVNSTAACSLYMSCCFFIPHRLWAVVCRPLHLSFCRIFRVV
jgi:hypothetical protein